MMKFFAMMIEVFNDSMELKEKVEKKYQLVWFE